VIEANLFMKRPVHSKCRDENRSGAQAAPSSIKGRQISFVIVRDEGKKHRIAEIASGGIWIEQAPVKILPVRFRKGAVRSGRFRESSESGISCTGVSLDSRLHDTR
jgi:hypothetical protein